MGFLGMSVGKTWSYQNWLVKVRRNYISYLYQHLWQILASTGKSNLGLIELYRSPDFFLNIETV